MVGKYYCLEIEFMTSAEEWRVSQQEGGTVMLGNRGTLIQFGNYRNIPSDEKLQKIYQGLYCLT